MPKVSDVASPSIATHFQKVMRGQGSGRELTVHRTDKPLLNSAEAPAGSASLSAAGLALAAKDHGPVVAPKSLKVGAEAPSVHKGPLSDAKQVKEGTETRHSARVQAPRSAATGAAYNSSRPGGTEAATSSRETRIPTSLGPNDTARQAQAFGGLNVRSSVGGAALTTGK